MTLGFEEDTLDAYRAALVRTDWRLDEPSVLVHQLGGVDRAAGHAITRERLVVAGRLIAIAQLVGPRLPEAEIHDVVTACLNERANEWEAAAPALEPRVASDEERVAGLDASLRECADHGGLTRAAWLVATYILQYLVRPEIPLESALQLSAELGGLSADAEAVLRERSPFGLGGAQLDEMLRHLDVRVRNALRTPVPWEQSPACDWIHIAAAATGAHAIWAGHDRKLSLRLSTTRAVERLAASRVSQDPRRYARTTALEHAREAAFHAAVSALRNCEHAKQDALDGLLEAASSGLIGAWATRRLESQPGSGSLAFDNLETT